MATLFSISDRAREKIETLLSQSSDQGSLFRIRVEGGGCSGFQYILGFDNAITPDDQLIEQGQAKVVVDEVSLGFLANAELDFEEDMMSSSFVIRNPNTSSRCGCGNSFSMA